MKLFSTHMPKTGGTTFFCGVLEHMFGDRLVLDCEEDAYGNRHGFVLEPLLFERAECVHGHYMPAKYRHFLGKARFSIWFRHPVTRSCSLYNITNRNFGHRSLEEFCEQPINHNTMTRFMEGMEFGDFDFVGITEEYDESLALFNTIYPHAPTEVEPMRVWNPNGFNAGYELSDQDRELLESINEQDFETYARGQERFNELRRTK